MILEKYVEPIIIYFDTATRGGMMGIIIKRFDLPKDAVLVRKNVTYESWYSPAYIKFIKMTVPTIV